MVKLPRDRTLIAPPPQESPKVDFADALGERYLSYALSTIMSRSLPDVRDGLKPVHRRLLFAMGELGLNPNTMPKKAAKVVGDVIGKFHPHGDQAVYETLVRLAQDFALRYPLIDGHGNFGNIDGDNAAAMRYTEARLSVVGVLLLEGLESGTVDFRPTYDNDGEEPVILPAAFPNLLANGASGIAVGMASSVPPHNLAELCAALLHLIKFPKATVADLMPMVLGPDFPTGGLLVEDAAQMQQAYETGRGSFRLRAYWQVEKLPLGGWQIVITEIPYQVQKARLIEKIAELLEAKKLPLLGDIRDESSDLVRLVLEPKTRQIDPAMLMESLFRQSDLETRFPLNMNLLDGKGVPRVMSLTEVLHAFLDHRLEVLQRRCRHRLAAVGARLEVLDGFLIVFLDLDRVIAIIRFEDEPKPLLMTEFGLSDIQVEAILNMRLRSLRKLEEMELRREHDKLSAEQTSLTQLLASEKAQWKALEAEIKALDKTFGATTILGRRRTRIGTPPEPMEIPSEALAAKEPITVLLSEKGWIRAVRGQDHDINEAKFKDGDQGQFTLACDSTDRLLLFASDGRFFTLGCDKIPRGKGFGEPLRLFVEIPAECEILAIHTYRNEARYIIASDDGRGFIVAAEQVLSSKRSGRQVLTAVDGAKPQFCLEIKTSDSHLVTVGSNQLMVIFPLGQVPQLAKGQGVILQKFAAGGLIDRPRLVRLQLLNLKEGLTFPQSSSGKLRTITELSPWLSNRAAKGSGVPPGFPKAGKSRG